MLQRRGVSGRAMSSVASETTFCLDGGGGVAIIHAPMVVPVQEGQVLAGKYRVERFLGMGAMGVVVAAHHLHLKQRLALKFLAPRLLEDPALAARFRREAQAAVQIRNEHVARVIDVGSLETGTPY